MRHLLAVALIACALPAVGCERVAGQTERDRAVEVEQQAINAYSEKVPEVDKLQNRFIEEWSKANEIEDLKAFQDAVEAQVIPALEAYVSALRVMPASSAELKAIHGIVVGAYEKAVEDFQTFVTGLTQDNVEERYKALLAAMDTVAEAEKRYETQLQEYYARNRVKLVRAQP